MRVLVACEFSGIVREAFRKRGHDAWSCDLLPTEIPSECHIQDNVLKHLNDNWDLMIAHPPCTYLCSSGLHWNKRRDGRKQKTEDALLFVQTLLNAPVNKIALENPIGCISTRIRKYDQKIQPWQFGHDASKATCLWLKNLPLLTHTKVIPPKGYEEAVFVADCSICACCGDEPFCEKHKLHYANCACIGPTEDGVTYITREGHLFATKKSPAPKPIYGNQTPSGQNKLTPSPMRAMDRSRTYTGIADAMAEQWG